MQSFDHKDFGGPKYTTRETFASTEVPFKNKITDWLKQTVATNSREY